MNRWERARYRAGLSQLEAAERSGVTRQTIGRLESGTGPKRPQAPIARKLADTYGVTVDYLLGLNDEEVAA